MNYLESKYGKQLNVAVQFVLDNMPDSEIVERKRDGEVRPSNGRVLIHVGEEKQSLLVYVDSTYGGTGIHPKRWLIIEALTKAYSPTSKVTKRQIRKRLSGGTPEYHKASVKRLSEILETAKHDDWLEVQKEKNFAEKRSKKASLVEQLTQRGYKVVFDRVETEKYTLNVKPDGVQLITTITDLDHLEKITNLLYSN